MLTLYPIEPLCFVLSAPQSRFGFLSKVHEVAKMALACLHYLFRFGQPIRSELAGEFVDFIALPGGSGAAMTCPPAPPKSVARRPPLQPRPRA